MKGTKESFETVLGHLDHMTRCFFIALLASVIVAVGCGNAPAGPANPNETFATSDQAQFRVELVASGLEVPWAFAFLPNDSMLFTERPGRVRIIEGGKLRPESVFKVPDVESSSESGLMDLSLHPGFATNGLLYMAYAYNSGGQKVKVVRYRYDGKTFVEPKIIIDNIPSSPNHAGTRARIGPDGKLYIATGDSTRWQLAQQMDSLAGKILRVNDDGTIPSDNPFVNQQGSRPEIWAYGVRNPQGIDWQPGSNLVFETEHGPSGFEGLGNGGDEFNLIERGKNYGWPVIHHRQTKEGMESPLLEYSPACAPASGMFYTGLAFPQFKGNYFFGCLRGTRIIRVILDGRNVVRQENLLEGTYGRIREMEEGPDGFIYFSTSNRDGRGSAAKDDDRIMRIVPTK